MIKESCVFKGILNSLIVYLCEIFSIVVRENVNVIIVVYNYLFGDVMFL